jgi:hypothetical protein
VSEAAAESGARLFAGASSPALLSQKSRRPRFALKRRPQAFLDAFDDRALFYDCFWHHDGRRVLLVGPPPLNLDYRAIVFEAGGTALVARFHSSLSVTVTELQDVPVEAREIIVSFHGDRFVLPIQPNHCDALAGRRLIFAINRDNELSWIREWAHWHVHHHGADAVVLFDNGSTAYAPDDVAAILAGTPGLAAAAVHTWPYKFGPIDPAVIKDAYWARFLQIGSMSVVLRRYGMQAYGLLDCDIDELATTRSGRSIFDLARDSRGGLVVFRGRWVEALPEPGSPPRPSHRAFRHLLEDDKAAESRHRKWALDPSRDWVQRLSVHPYWHWIEGRARGVKTMSDDASYFHFRAISTNWKRPPAKAPSEGLRREPALDRGFGDLTS